MLDKIHKVVARNRLVMTELSVLRLRCGPFAPAKVSACILFLLARPPSFRMFKIVQIPEKQYPGRLLDIIKLRRATGFFAKRIVDILEGLFEQVGVSHKPLWFK